MGFRVIANEDGTKVFFNDIDISGIVEEVNIIDNGPFYSGGKHARLYTIQIVADLEELNGMKMARSGEKI